MAIYAWKARQGGHEWASRKEYRQREIEAASEGFLWVVMPNERSLVGDYAKEVMC